MKINIYLLLTVVNRACVPISTSNSTIACRSLEIEYTGKEYSQNIGNVRISQANTGLTFYENIFKNLVMCMFILGNDKNFTGYQNFRQGCVDCICSAYNTHRSLP